MLRTIYLVNGQNGMMYDDEAFRWWTIQAFASKEDAERFIIEKQEEYLKDEKRFKELDDEWYKNYGLTGEKRTEWIAIHKKWRDIVDCDDPKTEWYITEIQFQE